ncbi:MAG: hypothetical protein ACI9U2_002781 [Bradymonadia bacterium]|jgi:hypothetical protein
MLRSLAAFLALALSAPAFAEPPAEAGAEAPKTVEVPRSPHRPYYQSVSVFRLNPLGLISRFQVGYMYKLWGNPKVDPSAPLGEKIKQGTYLKAAFNTQASPGLLRPGIILEAVPIALLRLSARLEQHTYWGAFNLITSDDTPTAPHDEDTLGDARSYGTTGWSARLDARVQIKLGPIAVRSELRAEYQSLNLEGDDTVYYEAILDTLVANDGWSLITDTDVLYFAGPKWIIGARHTWTKAIFDADDFLPGEDPDSANTNAVLHRLGPAIIYRIDNDKTGTLFNQPTVFLITQFWLNHDSRAGQNVTRAFPYTLIGFAFNGDL